MIHSTHIYDAYLEGNTLRWIGEEPPKESPKILRVKVEISEEKVKGNAAKAIEYLEKIAATGLITDEWVEEWQKSREDRPLPGRQ
jgi:hypothetical protein